VLCCGTLRYPLLCCAVLYCAVLYCAVLCCAVLCCAVCCAAPSYSTLIFFSFFSIFHFLLISSSSLLSHLTPLNSPFLSPFSSVPHYRPGETLGFTWPAKPLGNGARTGSLYVRSLVKESVPGPLEDMIQIIGLEEEESIGEDNC
jgi:hypothetical protein